MYRSERERKGIRAKRKYEEGINRHHDWDKPTKKIPPDKSHIILTISQKGNNVYCSKCREKLVLDDNYDNQLHREVVEKFKLNHTHDNN